MTPKEKAIILIDRYLDEVINETDIDFPLALPKRLALIAAEEQISLLLSLSPYMAFPNQVTYWQEVKQEIINL